MLKALFLDMDETLCDTLGANEQAKQLMVQALKAQYGARFDGQGVAGLTPMPSEPWWDDSAMIEYFSDMANWLKDIMPLDVANRFTL